MIHEDAVDLIQYFEGCYNEAYACPAHVSRGGTWKFLTIGYGHSGPDVRPGQKITTAEARDLLVRDLANVENYARRLVKIALDEKQFGAFCALTFNLKPGRLEKSRTLALLNVGDFGTFDEASAYRSDLGSLTGMARQWAQWRNVEVAGGKLQPLAGLVKRRACELELFFTGQWSPPADAQIAQFVSMPEETHEEPQVWRPGMRDPQLHDLHAALEAAGYPTTCGDAYTWVTAEALKAFQKANGLKVDGLYGRDTAAKLQQVLEARG